MAAEQSFDVYRLPEEHEAVREAVREVCAAKVAPHAAEAELKRKYLTPVAAGDAMFSYCLSEPEAGSDAASMTTKAVRDGDHWVLNGVKRWITNAGESEYYTVFAV